MELKKLMELVLERSKIPMTEEEVKAMAARIREAEREFAAQEKAQRFTPELLNKILY